MKLRLTLAFLAALHAVVLFAAFFAPYDYAEQHRDYPFAPPTHVHFTDAAGRFHPRPFAYGVTAPGVLFLWGSDGFGRDVFSRVLYGGQVSLLTGLVAAFLSLSLGLLCGTLAGFYGGWVDRLLMRGGELFLALPWLYLLLAVRAFLPLHISTTQAFFLLVAIIGTVGWVRPARM